MKKFKIFIYGVPGSGKTYVSQKMSKDLGLPLLETDTLKDELRQLATEEESPFLFLGTSQAYKFFGSLSLNNVIKGLKAVRSALAGRVNKEVESSDRIIIEGAFLDPDLLKDYGRLILVITSNEEQHRSQFFRHREENKDTVDEFKAARITQDFLISKARDLSIEIIENKNELF